jgi:NAD(P)-dependent dehydrogenase (short-subunit alcohol dehydrogenase family)
MMDGAGCHSIWRIWRACGPLCNRWKRGDRPINGLVLNAATQFGNVDQRTEDGFEITFAVNHLAHYLLLPLLRPRLAHGAIVMITTRPQSAEKSHRAAYACRCTAVGSARHRTAPQTGRHASLCGVQALQPANCPRARGVPCRTSAGLWVIAFNPGLTPETGLGRNNSRAVRAVAAALVPSLSPFLRINTLAGGGALLADLALGRIVPPPGRLYACQVKRRLTWPDPSELAQSDDVMAKPWRDSAMMIGLPGEL